VNGWPSISTAICSGPDVIFTWARAGSAAPIERRRTNASCFMDATS
jgi:hypothetical protein